MKQFRIALGLCGPEVMYSNVIRANSPEEAVEKYMRENNITDDQKALLIKNTVEHTPKRRAKKETEQ